MQTELMFSMPRPGDLFTAGSQNYRVFERLLAGPATNTDLINLKVWKYTSRISDIRAALEPYLMDVKATRLHEGLFEYSLKGNHHV